MLKPPSAALHRLAKLVLPAAAVALAASMVMKGRLPDPALILPALLDEPVQTETDIPEPFDVTRKGVTYTVTPLFSYELWGLVVSYHHAASFLDISHEMWKDYVNVKDICVIWGKNVETGVYKRMKFRNRDFTCFYSYPDQETGRLFTENALSNNHLLPADPLVARTVMSARKGDQVHLRGWLVSYGIKDTPYRRMSSTTRSDRGNGACETIYVTRFEILKKANPQWHALTKISIAAAVLSLAALIFI